MNVLILGNGISRLAFDRQIRGWPGPVWGCNYVFIDYGDILKCITGHVDVMITAAEYRKNNKLKYKILGGFKGPSYATDEIITCPIKFRKDSGSTLVAEALTQGHDVTVVGFDLGGRDVYSANHDLKNKRQWVVRWREILKTYNPNRITFMGHDHKPFLLSKDSDSKYSREYTRKRPHIHDQEYLSIYKTEIDYRRIYEMSPKVLLVNCGKRGWKIDFDGLMLEPGEGRFYPEGLARRYVADYPKEFRIDDTVKP